MNIYKDTGKTTFDFFISLAGLLVLLPLILFLAFIITFYDTGPIFFFQERIGKDFKKFKLFKFRTMVVNADKMGAAVTKGEDPRITPIGRFLRQYKLDELPQLINVLKGDMSLVGPRPEVEQYVVLFKKEYERILSIKPGITDYAALAYRDEEKILNNYEDADKGYVKEVLPAKIALYEKYLREICFSTDLKIIFKTLWRIVAASQVF